MPVVEYVDSSSGQILEIDELDGGFKFFSNDCTVPMEHIPTLIKSLQIAYMMKKVGSR
jgi:hypothetical protein